MFRSLIKTFLLRFGYELRKAHPESYPEIRTIDVLELAVRELMTRQCSRLAFVQIGANDGVTGDPIRRFILEFGWPGVLVEPQPEIFERLRKNYPNQPQLRFEQCAIAGSSGTARFYTVRENGSDGVFAATLASFDRSRVERYVRGREATVEELSVPTLTPADLLRKHDLMEFDLLQIDAEGYDFELLKLFALGASGPSIIHFESGNLAPKVQRECYRHLCACGYRVLTLGGDTLAMREDRREMTKPE
jgi:FkbM family methyltransferase